MINRLNPAVMTIDDVRQQIQKLSQVRLAHAIGVNSAVADAVTNTATPTLLSAGHVVPLRTLGKGVALQVRAMGVYSTVGDTLQLDLVAIAGATTVVLADCGAVTLDAADSKAWQLMATVHALSGGASASVQTTIEAAVFDAQTLRQPANLVTLNALLQQQIAIRATWGTASAGNTVAEQTFILGDVGA